MAKNPLFAALDKVEKTYKDTIRDINVAGKIDRISLTSPQLNFLFGGGFPVGRIIQLHGPESGGKSTLSTYIAGVLQKQPTHNIIVYVDFERTFEASFARRLGMDVEDPRNGGKLVFLRPENGEEAFAALEELVKTGEIALIIFDSDTTMPSINQIAKEYGAATFGAGAKLMSDALRKFNPILEKYRTSMIVISQERDAVGEMYGPGYKITGGRAIKFYASNRSRVQRIDYIKDKGIITGIQMRVKNEKNKAGIPYREAELNLDFNTGFDVSKEYLDFIISLGICEQKGAWFYMPQHGLEKANGRDNVQKWLDEHPAVYEVIKKEINERLCSETSLDRDAPPPEDDEESFIEEEIPEIPESKGDE